MKQNPQRLRHQQCRQVRVTWDHNERRRESDLHPTLAQDGCSAEGLTEALAWEATGRRTPQTWEGHAEGSKELVLHEGERRVLCPPGSMILEARVCSPQAGNRTEPHLLQGT